MAITFAASSAIVYGAWQLRDVFKSKAIDLPPNSLLEMARFSIPSFLMITMVAIMCNIDIILVRHYCPPDQAGYYATATILGRIAFFLPSSLLMVLFPSVAKVTASGTKDHQYLWVSLGLTTILSGIVFLVFFLAGQSIIQLVYGNQFFPQLRCLQLLQPLWDYSPLAMLSFPTIWHAPNLIFYGLFF